MNVRWAPGEVRFRISRRELDVLRGGGELLLRVAWPARGMQIRVRPGRPGAAGNLVLGADALGWVLEVSQARLREEEIPGWVKGIREEAAPQLVCVVQVDARERKIPGGG